MAAKKSVPKTGKGKTQPKVKPVAKKPAAVKTVAPAKKAPAKPLAPAKPAVTKPTAIKVASTIDTSEKKTLRTTPPVPTAHATSKPRPAAEPVLAEAADDSDDSTLLSGPRNVQPYIPKRGEQYMSREQLDHFRDILQIWKQDLMLEVDRTVSHMKDEAANFPDPNDRATQEEEFSLELRTRDRERKLIRKIDEAIGRIEDSSYGYCLETGEPIGVKRLEARPVATLSIEAQERRERREKQYGDRDDRYR
jgi:DnaK suppressor protein